MTLKPEDERKLTITAQLGALIAEGENTAFWREVAEYLERRREQIRNDGFDGNPEELDAFQARENELAQLVEWMATAHKEGVAAAKELEKEKAV